MARAPLPIPLCVTFPPVASATFLQRPKTLNRDRCLNLGIIVYARCRLLAHSDQWIEILNRATIPNPHFTSLLCFSLYVSAYCILRDRSCLTSNAEAYLLAQAPVCCILY